MFFIKDIKTMVLFVLRNGKLKKNIRKKIRKTNSFRMVFVILVDSIMMKMLKMLTIEAKTMQMEC